MSAPAELAISRGPSRGEISLWITAGAVVLSAHLAFAFAYRALAPEPEPPAAEEMSMEVELSPIPVSMPESVATEELAPETPVETAEPVEEASQAVEPDAQTVPEEQTEIVREQPVEEPQREIAEETPPEEVQPEQEVAEVPPEPEIMRQDRVEAVNPEVVLPLPEEVVKPEPKPQPKVVERVEPKPRPQRQEQPRAAKKSEPRKQPVANAKPAETTKPSSADSRAMSAAKAPNPARWNSRVRAAIARSVSRLRAGRGTVTISFVVSSSGAVSSVRVSGSSGDPRLDAAAVGAVQRARVPAPPDGLTGSHPFAIPVQVN